MPKGKDILTTTLRITEILLKPSSPGAGPPLPQSFDLSWPGFFTRGIKRLIEEPPWVTIPRHGLIAEIKKEFEVVTGQKIG